MRYFLTVAQWHYLDLVYDSTNISLYVNGVLNGTTFGGAITDGGIVYIGTYVGRMQSVFNGSIDQVNIYNVTLTAAQIAAIYNGGTSKYNMIESSLAQRGETWSACVTPIDGYYDGNTACTSANITVLNSIPTHTTPFLNSTLSGNYTTANLTAYNQSTADADNDAVTNIWDWMLNGTAFAYINMPFDTNVSSAASNAIRDYSLNKKNGTSGRSCERGPKMAKLLRFRRLLCL